MAFGVLAKEHVQPCEREDTGCTTAHVATLRHKASVPVNCQIAGLRTARQCRPPLTQSRTLLPQHVGGRGNHGVEREAADSRAIVC